LPKTPPAYSLEGQALHGLGLKQQRQETTEHVAWDSFAEPVVRLTSLPKVKGKDVMGYFT